MADIKQLRELEAWVGVWWSTLNERDAIARDLWNAVKPSVGDAASYADCQRSIGGSVDSALALAECLGLNWRAILNHAMRQMDSEAALSSLPKEVCRSLVTAIIRREAIAHA